jgi:restriction system protein
MKFNDALSRVAWQDFEVLVANHYRDQGYDVAHCGDGRFGMRDGNAVDLRMLKAGKLTLVHCRHESVSRVDAGAVARLLATAAEDGAAEAIVISSADIPQAAREVGEAGGATLIDGVGVRAMLGERLIDLHPVRSLPGVDAQHGEAHIVVRGEMPRSRGRRGWRLRMPARVGGKRGGRWVLVLLAVIVLAALAYYAPTLKRLAVAPHPDAAQTQEVSLPTPPAH